MKKLLKLVSIFLLLTAVLFAQWTKISSSPPGFFNSIVAVNDTLYACHFNEGIFRSINGGVSWQQINYGLDTNNLPEVYEILSYGGNLFAATEYGIYKSTNKGNDWIKKSKGITIGHGSIYESCVSIFEYKRSLFTGTYNGIYRSTDNAENWFITNLSGEQILAQNFTYHNGILFAGCDIFSSGNGYKSYDNGITWKAFGGYPVSGFLTFYSEPGKLWAGTIMGAWLSTDGGSSWENRSNGLSPDPYNTSFVSVNGKLITSMEFGGSGVFISENDGLSWQNFGQGLPFLTNINKLIIYKDKIIAATSDSLWWRDISETITSLKRQNDLPEKFRLLQNYPNPFNPVTTIQFSLIKGSFTKLEIFNSLGEKISELVSENLSAGTYKYNWDAEGFPSGVYFYRLTSGRYTETKKLLLLK